MIRIENEFKGERKYIRCKNCGRILSFEDEDIQREGDKEFIECECKEEIVVVIWRMGFRNKKNKYKLWLDKIERV